MDQAARWRDAPQFVDIVFVVTECDEIEAALRRFAAHQRIKPALAEHLVDGTNPVGPFGMSRWCEMVEACGMAQKKRRHAIPWRVECAFEEAPIASVLIKSEPRLQSFFSTRFLHAKRCPLRLKTL